KLRTVPADMDRRMPWDKLIGLVRPHYPTAGEQGGRPPTQLERMLRVYCPLLWFNLSDPGVEEALYDSDMWAWILDRKLLRTRPRSTSSDTCWKSRHGCPSAEDRQPTKNQDGEGDPKRH